MIISLTEEKNEFWRENAEFTFIAVASKLIIHLLIHSTNIIEF